MYSEKNYRQQAEHARLLAAMAHQPELKELLRRAARNYDDRADAMEFGKASVSWRGREFIAPA